LSGFIEHLSWKEKIITFIGSIVVLLMILTPMFLHAQYMDDEKQKVLDGKPTYEGIVVSVTHSAGSLGHSDITTVELENFTFGIKGIYSFKTDAYYNFWVKDDRLLKAEETIK